MTKLAQYLRNDGEVQSRWRYLSERNYYIELTKRTGEYQATMAKETLNMAHPHFSHSVDETLRRAKGSVQGMLIHAIHQILLGKFITFTDCDGAENVMVSVTGLNPQGHVIEVEGLVVVFEYFKDKGMQLPDIHKASFQTIKVSSNELEKRYPKWEARKTIGEGMLLEGEELMTYIFSTNETGDLVLPENDLI